MKLLFTWDLATTGANVSISDGVSSGAMFAWDVTDALGDLLRCLVQLLQGYEYAWCHWEDDPGGHRWVFTRDGSNVHIKILRFPDSFVGYGAPEEWADSYFETACSLLKFATKARNEARRLLHERGVDGYGRRRKFPVSEYEALRQLIRERQAR